MPTTNARKHVIPSSTETSVTRATMFQAALESVRDIVPVANTTARAQLVTDLSAAGVGQAPSSTKPLVVYRHDAPGLHRLEYTIDGTVWLPASGKLSFASSSAATSWATSNSGYLTSGDRCLIVGVEYLWTGTAWAPVATRMAAGSVACPNTAGGGSAPIFWSDLIDVTFPTGLFSSAPQVFVQTVGPATQVPLGGIVEQITATGCKVRGTRIGSVPATTFSVEWFAVQS